jgi:uncharacterized phage protein gp47/JayE
MMTKTIYEQMLVDAGIPTTEAGMKAEWNKLNDESDVKISNDSAWSPFWRLISAIVTKPALWLVELLINHALPNAFLKDAQGKWLNLLAWAVDLERKPATKARGKIRFTRESSAGEVVVEAGILVATPPINGKVYRVKTTEAVTLADGTINGLVPVEAEHPGKANNLGPGYYKILPEPVDGIESVANEADWITISGADEEPDDSLRLRCRNQFSAVGQYHHDAAYRAAISLFAGIAPNYVWFEHGAPRGPGSANAYIMIDSGCPSQSFVDGINAYIRDKGHHGHGDDMLCKPMPGAPKSLTVTVFHSSVLPEDKRTALKEEVTNRIRYAFRENQDFKDIIRTMPFSRFSFSRLSDELHGQLTDIESLAFSLSDIKSAMELPILDTLTVNLELS